MFCRVLSVEVTGNRGKGASGKARTAVALDNGESFVLSAEQAAGLDLAEGGELPEAQYEEIMRELRPLCMQKCGALLGGRDYTVQRLREKLLQAGFPASVTEECLHKLREAGYLNDGRYAENYVRTHICDRSRLRIRMDLSARGVGEEEIREAFRKISLEVDLEEEQKAQIRRLLRKRGYDPSSATFEERQKVMGFLHRKGFRQDLIRQAAAQPF